MVVKDWWLWPLLALILVVLVVLLGMSLAAAARAGSVPPVGGGAAEPRQVLSSLAKKVRLAGAENRAEREQGVRAAACLESYLVKRMPYFVWHHMDPEIKHPFGKKLDPLAAGLARDIIAWGQAGRSDGQIMAEVLKVVLSAVPPGTGRPPGKPVETRARSKGSFETTLAALMRQQTAGENAPPARYLDVGCDEGKLTKAIAEIAGLSGPESVFGCEPVDAEKDRGDITFVRASADKLPFPDGHFRLASCVLSAHHFDDLEASLREIRRVLAPGGVLFIRDHDCPDAAFGEYLDFVHFAYAVVMEGKIELRPGRETEDFEKHRKEFETFYTTRRELNAAVLAAGFDRVEPAKGAPKRRSGGAARGRSRRAPPQPDRCRLFDEFYLKP